MMLRSALVMALREIRRNVLRSGLTALGIVIGVASVIAMVTLGEGASARVSGEISSLGNNLLFVRPGSERHGPLQATASPFTMSDYKAVRREVAGMAIVAPTVSRQMLLVYGNKNYNTTATGATNEFIRIRNFSTDLGRLFRDAEITSGAPVCILGATVRRELFSHQDPVGAVVRAENIPCRVIGVLQPKGQSTFGTDQDDFLVMPLKTLQRRVAGTTFIDMFFVSALADRDTLRVKNAVESLLRQRRRIQPGELDDFAVHDMKEIAKTVSSVTGILTALLGAIAAVSLLVGGIGIMNIMLVAVTERTREIGIRLAIGARGREVLLQFLVEAVMLSLFGGLIGMALGLVGSYFATRALGLPFPILPHIIAVAFLFSAAVGISFGYFPARKAARLNPIDALRYE